LNLISFLTTKPAIAKLLLPLRQLGM